MRERLRWRVPEPAPKRAQAGLEQAGLEQEALRQALQQQAALRQGMPSYRPESGPRSY